jgi:hypothetical protein
MFKFSFFVSFQSYQVDNRELLHIVVRRQRAAGWLATIVWKAITSYGEAGDELCEAADMLRGGCQRSAGGRPGASVVKSELASCLALF